MSIAVLNGRVSLEKFIPPPAASAAPPQKTEAVDGCTCTASTVVKLSCLSVNSEEFTADYGLTMNARISPFATADNAIRTIDERLARFQRNLSVVRPDLAEADWDITVKQERIKVTGDISAHDKRVMEARLNRDQSLTEAVQGYMGAAESYLETNECNPPYCSVNAATGQITVYNFKNVIEQLEGTISFKELSNASSKLYWHPSGGPPGGPEAPRGHASLEVLASRLASMPLESTESVQADTSTGLQTPLPQEAPDMPITPPPMTHCPFPPGLMPPFREPPVEQMRCFSTDWSSGSPVMVELSFLPPDSEEHKTNYQNALLTRTIPLHSAARSMTLIEERLEKFQKNLALARPDLARSDWDVTIKNGKLKVKGVLNAEDRAAMERRLNRDQTLVNAVQTYMGAAEAYLETNERNPPYYCDYGMNGPVTLRNFKDVVGQLEGTISFRELINTSWKPYEDRYGRYDPGNFHGGQSLDILASRLTSLPLTAD